MARARAPRRPSHRHKLGGKGALAVVSAVLVATLALGMPVGAVQPDEILPDKTLEQRARALSAELRCLVCQNQSIDDSNAPLARDLRLLVRERLKAGDSDVAVREFVVARYGEFVLLRPPVGPSTLLLWLGPPAMLLLTAIFLLIKARGARTAARINAEPLTPEEAKRLEALLKDKA